MRDIVRWVVLHAVPYVTKIWRLEKPMVAYNPECPISTVTHEGCSMVVWAAISSYSNLLVPLLPFPTELLQGSTQTGCVMRCIPWSRRYFRTTMQFSKTTMPYSYSLNCSVIVSRARMWTSTSSLTNIIARSEHHWTILISFGKQIEQQSPTSNISKATWRCSWRRRYTIPLHTVQNLYGSSPRMIAAVMKTKGGPTRYK
jgi:hypothetical protein